MLDFVQRKDNSLCAKSFSGMNWHSEVWTLSVTWSKLVSDAGDPDTSSNPHLNSIDRATNTGATDPHII